MTVNVDGLDHVGLAVSDVQQSVNWYEQVLGLQRAHQAVWGEYPAVMEAHGTGVALFARTSGQTATVDDPVRHVAFRTSRLGLEAAKDHLNLQGIEFAEGDYGIAWSIYFPDPDGYCIEVTTYEPSD
jgi:catechol 2,3-dioxygenase-like lactoylglutathione lyase family enzyme